MRLRAVSLILALFLFAPTWAEEFITLEQPELYDLQAVGFEIPRRAELQIEAVGMWEPSRDSWWSRWWSRGDEDPMTVSSGFSLERPTNLRVYSIYEKTENGREPVDYGWIVDLRTRERVWHPRDARPRRAGGGEKNRLVDEEIELPAGSYVLYFGTDDSHSFEQFHVAAPHDPFNWGIALLPGRGFEAASFRKFEPGQSATVLVEFVRVGDDAFHQQPFRVSRDATLHVYALGEYDYDDDQFYDHGWIVDAASGKTVWEMTGSNTDGAGGAEKNRMFDGLVELPRGDYILFYATDGSHAYDTWNSATPFDARSWGITVRHGPGFEASRFALIDEADLEQSGDYLVRIVRVGDDERIREPFTLDAASWVEIRAIGEGSSGDMYDYGYIRDQATGRVVWKMYYDETEHAGGASKNRIVVDEVRLEPGEYEAVYVTDGSHSFHGWNASRPRDPMNWGLTIRRVDH